MRITHQWVERSASKPPAAPPAPVYPPDGGEANGTDIVFQWTAAQDPDGDADRRLPVRTVQPRRHAVSAVHGFLQAHLPHRRCDQGKGQGRGQDKIIAKAQYTLPQPGLLTPDRQYYWHVRAMDDKGVWGPWSKTWSFTPRGPAYPLDVAVDYDPAKGAGMLRWKANPRAVRPVKYRVYGSDEKGFTIADQRFQSTVGVTQGRRWPPGIPGSRPTSSPKRRPRNWR